MCAAILSVAAWMWLLGFVISRMTLRGVVDNQLARVLLAVLWPLTMPACAILTLFANGGDFS